MAKVGEPWRRLDKLNRMTTHESGVELPGMPGTQHTEKPKNAGSTTNPK